MALRDDTYWVVSGSLEPLRQRLQIGEQVEGRIIKVLSNGRYILRVGGYNFCMESNYLFQELQSVVLMVKRLYPLIEFFYYPPRKTSFDPLNYHCNLIA
jgi:hypothetical protein